MWQDRARGMGLLCRDRLGEEAVYGCTSLMEGMPSLLFVRELYIAQLNMLFLLMFTLFIEEDAQLAPACLVAVLLAAPGGTK